MYDEIIPREINFQLKVSTRKVIFFQKSPKNTETQFNFSSYYNLVPFFYRMIQF